MHPRYYCWINHVFDHPVEIAQWYFGPDVPIFDDDDESISTLIAETFERSGSDLAKFSDAQVNQGIWYLSSTASDYCTRVRDGSASFHAKIRAIRSVFCLYQDCFARRCTGSLGHLDEPDAADLNSACYMFWDIIPWGYLVDVPLERELADAVLETLKMILAIPHRGCREGALHGLGEVAFRYESRVACIVDEFLCATILDDDLKKYALRARNGHVL